MSWKVWLLLGGVVAAVGAVAAIAIVVGAARDASAPDELVGAPALSPVSSPRSSPTSSPSTPSQSSITRSPAPTSIASMPTTVATTPTTLAATPTPSPSSLNDVTVELTSEHTTSIWVDLERPDRGRVWVTYTLKNVSTDDFQVVVGAKQDVHELLGQYGIPYEDPRGVDVDRGSDGVRVSLPLVARDGFEFLFPTVSLVGSWIPLWENMELTVIIPEQYEVTHLAEDGFDGGLQVNLQSGRWVVTGKAMSLGNFTIEYSRVGTTPP